MTWRSLLKTGKSWASPEGLGSAPRVPTGPGLPAGPQTICGAGVAVGGSGSASAPDCSSSNARDRRVSVPSSTSKYSKSSALSSDLMARLNEFSSPAPSSPSPLPAVRPAATSTIPVAPTVSTTVAGGANRKGGPSPLPPGGSCGGSFQPRLDAHPQVCRGGRLTPRRVERRPAACVRSSRLVRSCLILAVCQYLSQVLKRPAQARFDCSLTDAEGIRHFPRR